MNHVLSPGARHNLQGIAFASPWIVGFLIFTLVPVVASGFFSFTSFNLFQAPEFVGLDNYRGLLQDHKFGLSIANTLYLTVVGLPLTIGLSLACALALTTRVRGQPVYRAIVYLPSILPVIVAAYLWRYMLTGPAGFVNMVLSAIGVSYPAWTLDPDFTKPAVMFVMLWTIGGMTVIYIAALQGVPQSLLEAAEIDGAGRWARFRFVTWPTISPVTLFQVIVGLIAWLQIFTVPYLMGQPGSERHDVNLGGPAGSLLTYTVYLFQRAFVFLQMGYASAMAWLLFLVTIVITLVLLATSRRWVHYDEDQRG